MGSCGHCWKNWRKKKFNDFSASDALSGHWQLYKIPIKKIAPDTESDQGREIYSIRMSSSPSALSSFSLLFPGLKPGVIRIKAVRAYY